MSKITKMFSFKGRARRAKFLQTLALCFFIWLAARYIEEHYISPNLCHFNENWICYLPGEVREGVTLDMIVAVLLFIPLLSVMVRRMHDHDRSGWWLLSIIPAAYWLLVNGDREENRYG